MLIVWSVGWLSGEKENRESRSRIPGPGNSEDRSKALGKEHPDLKPRGWIRKEGLLQDEARVVTGIQIQNLLSHNEECDFNHVIGLGSSLT